MTQTDTPTIVDLGPAVRQLTELVAGVRDDALTAPTPCADTPVAALLDHLMGLTVAFRDAARKATGSEIAAESRPGQASAEHLHPEWRTLLPQRLADLAQAWRDPAAWVGMTEAGGLVLPADVTGTIAVDELVLHGWDLARATGQPFSCDPASTQACLAFTTAMSQPGEEAGREGLFGPVVPVPDDAPDLDRALGFSGRDPAWTPPAQHQARLVGQRRQAETHEGQE